MEFYPQKSFYIIYIFAIIGLLSYGWLGAPANVQNLIIFYVIFLGLPSLLIFFIDLFTAKKFEQIDTITMDNPEDGSLDEITGITLPPQNQLIAGIILAGLLALQIMRTGFGIVSAPQFTVFEGNFGNSLLSGSVGIIENLFFFGVIYAILRANIINITGNRLAAFIIAMAIGTAIFVGYHTFRYASSEIALLSVALFAMLGITLVEFTNSLIIADILHFTNNFLITSGFAAGAVAVSILF